MNVYGLFRRVGPVDARSIGRDPMLAWLPLMSLLMALAFRLGVPPLAAWLDAAYGFDLVPYYDLIMSFYVVMMPGISGMVIGFLMIDERDDGTLHALMVTPVSLDAYFSYRLLVPVLIGFVLTVAGFLIADLVRLPFGELLLVSLLAALTAPFIALFLAAFAENKVAGFALIKLLNALGMIPLAAYFLPFPWHLVAGFLPTYWPLKATWLAAAGATWWPYFVGGVAVCGLVSWLLLERFRARVAR